MFPGLLISSGNTTSTIISFFLIFSSTSILLVHDDINIFEELWRGMREMRNLIPLIIMLPTLGWIVEQENYISAMLDRQKKLMNRPSNLYLVLLLMMMMSTLFFGLGSIFLLFSLSSTLLSKQQSFWTKEKDIIILQGFSLSALWSLTEPSMIFALEATDAPVIPTFMHGLVLSIIGSILGLLLFLKRYQRSSIKYYPLTLVSTFEGTSRKAWLLVGELSFILVGFCATILLGVFVYSASITDIVLLSLLIWIFVYFIFKRKLTLLFSKFWKYFTKEMESKSHQLSYLMPAGLMVVTLVQTGLGERIFLFIITWSESVFILDMIIILPLIIVTLGFLGMPPVPSMVLIASVLLQIQLEYSSTVLVLMLLTGNVVSFLISPVTLPALLLSSLNHLSPFQNGLKLNLGYAILFFIFAQLYIHFVHILSS